MAKLVGTWVLGDELRSLVYRVKDTATSYRDLTGATVKLEGKRHGDVSLAINVTGTVDPDQVNNRGKVTFTDITATLSLSAGRHIFRCKVHVTQSGDGWTEDFEIAIEVWP